MDDHRLTVTWQPPVRILLIPSASVMTIPPPAVYALRGVPLRGSATDKPGRATCEVGQVSVAHTKGLRSGRISPRYKALPNDKLRGRLVRYRGSDRNRLLQKTVGRRIAFNRQCPIPVWTDCASNSRPAPTNVHRARCPSPGPRISANWWRRVR